MAVVTDTDAHSLGTYEPTARAEDESRPVPHNVSRKRFTWAVLIGTTIALPLFLWLLWSLWTGSVNVLRGVPYDDFYDLQARSMFHGHFWLPSGTMGIEAFVHHGHDYTYFGLFPSLIRMPVLLLTSRFDGQLTAPSMLAAWILTALTSSLMLWRLRVLMRGDALLGRAEAASYGALMATILGGSVVLYLGATPFVFNEDFAWSIPLTVGSLFALLGVLEHATWRRVVAGGVLVMCASLNRNPPGWTCCLAALLIAGWFATGRGGRDNRRWVIPMVVVGVVPFLTSCAVTYAKFGIPIGPPMADQVWTQVNAHRRFFLAANGGKAFSFSFLPSTLAAYFQPVGVRFSGIFPFIAPPGSPAPWLAGAVMDQSYPTASFTDTSPLLLLLGIWGVVTAMRPKSIGQVHLTRIILVSAAAGAGGVLLWGYMTQRYLADAMPFFIIAAAIGMIDIWRRLETGGRLSRGGVLAALTAVAVYCIAANLAVSAFPVGQWTSAQSARFISAQRALSVSSLRTTIKRGSRVPLWGPAGQIFAMNNCSGLYLSSGNDLTDDPGQQIEDFTWMPVEQSPSFSRVVGFSFARPLKELTTPVTVLTYGKSRLVLEQVPREPGYMRFDLYNSGTSVNWPSPASWKLPISISDAPVQWQVVVTTDPNVHRLIVQWSDNEVMIDHYIGGDGPAVVQQTPSTPGQPPPTVTVSDVPLSTSPLYATDQADRSQLTLCRSLTQSH